MYIVSIQTPTNLSAILPPSANINNTALATPNPLPEMPILAKGVEEIRIYKEFFTVQPSFRLLSLENTYNSHFYSFNKYHDHVPGTVLSTETKSHSDVSFFMDVQENMSK